MQNPPSNLQIGVTLAEWLSYTGKGVLNNFADSVPANTSNAKKQIYADQGLDYVLGTIIQFDGVLSGQVAYQVLGGQGCVMGGWAFQTYPHALWLVSDKGAPLTVEINNASDQEILYNIIYVSVGVDVWQREVLPALTMFPIGTR